MMLEGYFRMDERMVIDWGLGSEAGLGLVWSFEAECVGDVGIREALQVLSGTVSRCATGDFTRAGFFPFISLRSRWSLRTCRLALKGFFYGLLRRRRDQGSLSLRSLKVGTCEMFLRSTHYGGFADVAGIRICSNHLVCSDCEAGLIFV